MGVTEEGLAYSRVGKSMVKEKLIVLYGVKCQESKDDRTYITHTPRCSVGVNLVSPTVGGGVNPV